MFKKVLFSTVAAIAVFTMLATGACAKTGPVVEENFIFDDFSTVTVKDPFDPDPALPWWIINDGAYDPANPWFVQYYDLYGPSSSLTTQKEGPNKFVRLEIGPENAEGWYVNVEASEAQTLYEPGSGDWLPTVGESVYFSARVRFSELYENNTAVGTAGVGLWNSPLDYTGYPVVPNNSIFMSYGQPYSFIPGLSFNVMNIDLFTWDPAEVYQLPIDEVDATEWHEYSFVWSVDETGVQSVTFYVDFDEVGSYTIQNPLQAIGGENWVDNQDGWGGITTPLTGQYMDIDHEVMYKGTVEDAPANIVGLLNQ